MAEMMIPDNMPRKTNTGAQLTIIVLFLAAVGLAIGAAAIQFKNKREFDEIARKAWGETEPGLPVALPANVQPTELTDWERAELIRSVEVKLNRYLERRHNGKLEENPEDAKQAPYRMVTKTAAELSPPVRVDGNSKFHTPSQRRFRDDKRQRWLETSFRFEFDALSRRDALRLALALEDKFPFAKVRDMIIERDDDSAGQDMWKVEMTLVWYDRDGAPDPAGGSGAEPEQ